MALLTCDLLHTLHEDALDRILARPDGQGQLSVRAGKMSKERMTVIEELLFELSGGSARKRHFHVPFGRRKSL
jgi:hypothetical protein